MMTIMDEKTSEMSLWIIMTEKVWYGHRMKENTIDNAMEMAAPRSDVRVDKERVQTDTKGTRETIEPRYRCSAQVFKRAL